MRREKLRLSAAVGLTLLLAVPVVSGQESAATSALTKEQMREFLLNARVMRSTQTGKGVTRPHRLTLSDGTLTHDALFQSVDERRAAANFARARGELNFVDSYHYNIAAYVLAELLGVDYMMPMSVERSWNGKTGSITWWVDDVMMDEGERLKKAVRPPNPDLWNKQMYRMRVFSQLVHDTDRNLTNVLVTSDWKVWMIDFTRAFRLWEELPGAKDLTRCDREMLQRLRGLSRENVEEKAGKHLTASELDAVMARRDLLVAHFEKLVAERGEDVVLF